MTAQLTPLPETSLLRIEAATNHDVLELHLSGEMDISTRGELAALFEALEPGGTTSVSVNLASLEFCDASGIAELVKVRKAAARTGRRLATHGMGPQVGRLLLLTGTAGFLGAVLPR